MCVNPDDLPSAIDASFLFLSFSYLADFSNAVCSPPGTPKRSDSVGVIYWQVRRVILHLLGSFYLNPVSYFHRHQKCGREPTLSHFYLDLSF